MFYTPFVICLIYYKIYLGVKNLSRLDSYSKSNYNRTCSKSNKWNSIFNLDLEPFLTSKSSFKVSDVNVRYISVMFLCFLLLLAGENREQRSLTKAENNHQPATKTLQDGQTAANTWHLKKYACQIISYSVFSSKNRAI